MSYKSKFTGAEIDDALTLAQGTTAKFSRMNTLMSNLSTRITTNSNDISALNGMVSVDLSDVIGMQCVKESFGRVTSLASSKTYTAVPTGNQGLIDLWNMTRKGLLPAIIHVGVYIPDANNKLVKTFTVPLAPGGDMMSYSDGTLEIKYATAHLPSAIKNFYIRLSVSATSLAYVQGFDNLTPYVNA